MDPKYFRDYLSYFAYHTPHFSALPFSIVIITPLSYLCNYKECMIIAISCINYRHYLMTPFCKMLIF